MKGIVLLVFLVLVKTTAPAQEKVVFVEDEFVIDGTRPAFISDEQMRVFRDVHKSDALLPDFEASYFLGYTAEHFYIFIEFEGDSIIERDRAYQNGDGFHFTIGFAQEDGADTDEFYVFGFSPPQDWTNKIRWYHNVDLSMKRLGENVLFETSSSNGITGFELLMPWSVMPPYHPWIHSNLGFNLCFVKAVNEKDRIFSFIETDRKMQSEQSKRKYVNLSFSEPIHSHGFYSMPMRHNVVENERMEIQIAGYSENGSSKTIQVDLFAENELIVTQQYQRNLAKGFSRIFVELDELEIEQGNYEIHVFTDDVKTGEHVVSVFEFFDTNDAARLLNKGRNSLSAGSYHTLLFYNNELASEWDQLKDYESSASLVSKISSLNNYIRKTQKEKDPIINKRGIFRRGFLSEIDQTIRPYTVYVPEDYDPMQEYPLLIYLHGSGQDDTALFSTDFIRQGFIVLAPNGRGTSNCFATMESQKDIMEAISDVKQNYNIDDENIILSGFSMGGYGVLRTYYENPGIFSALAILSGHPDLAARWGIENSINFLDEKLAAVYSDIPIFIFHGEKDLNCPYELMLRFVDMLAEHNDNIVFLTEEDKGHEAMNEVNKHKYFTWLKENVRK